MENKWVSRKILEEDMKKGIIYTKNSTECANCGHKMLIGRKNKIKNLDCINDVEREIGIKDICISRCCRGLQKTAGGYIWKYGDEII